MEKKIEKKTLPSVKKIIMVASGKGGVGKSTVAAGLALSLSLEGFSVGILDADIFGPSVPTLFQLLDADRPIQTEIDGKKMIEPLVRFGIKIMSVGFFVDQKDAVIWRGPLVSNVLKQLLTETNWGELDYLIVDTPPGTGDILITLLQEFYITGAIVVTTPQKIALADVQKAISMLQDEHIGAPILGLVENMSWFSPSLHPDEKYFLFGKGGGQFLSETFNLPLLAQIPINEKLCESCDKGILREIHNDINVKKAFDELVNKVLSIKREFKLIK